MLPRRRSRRLGGRRPPAAPESGSDSDHHHQQHESGSKSSRRNPANRRNIHRESAAETPDASSSPSSSDNEDMTTNNNAATTTTTSEIDETDSSGAPSSSSSISGDESTRSASDETSGPQRPRVEKVLASRWRRLPPQASTGGGSSDSLLVVLESEDGGGAGGDPENQPKKEAGVTMEYLVKFEGVSYRHLEWRTRRELGLPSPLGSGVRSSIDDVKILNFHKRFTDGDASKECPLTPQEEGSFRLYCQIDRILTVRGGKRQLKKREYLVKWRLLGYAEATWENEKNLTSTEDLKAIERFIRINQAFEYPVSSAPVKMKMASDAVAAAKGAASRDSAVKSRDGSSTSENNTDKPAAPLAPGVFDQRGSTRMWRMFLKRKLTATGVYLPSAEWAGGAKKMEASRTLMPHQQEGVKWLFFNSEVHRHGSLLADEMGLGKTCQSIVFLEHLLEVMSAGKGVGCHGLVIVQKSVMENWRREFEVWAPHLNVFPLYGGREDRELAIRYERHWLSVEDGRRISAKNSPSGIRKFIKPDVVLTTYEALRTADFRTLNRGLTWTCVVVDECQKVKGGKSSVLLQSIEQLKRDCTLLLTGTPIQNTTDELFPMLALLHPTRFSYNAAAGGGSGGGASASVATTPKSARLRERATDGGETAAAMAANDDCWSFTRFSAGFAQIQDSADCMQLTERLHGIMMPYILRREKAHVLKSLPPKIVKLVKIPLTLVQKRVYSSLYHKSIKAKGLKFSNVHMQLRKCCIHPFLIERIEGMILEGKIPEGDSKDNAIDGAPPAGAPSADASEGAAPAPLLAESSEERYKRLLLDSSGKFVLLKKMLEAFHQAGRKVLVFSFFKVALDLVEDLLAAYNLTWGVERVDGDTSTEERQLAIDRFNLDPEQFLFLCTTRAGGLGINLTAASAVIHLDSDFNPQHDLQAQARCHRIGQHHTVNVFHFIAEHTYEDYMLFTVAGRKLGLEAVLLGRLDATKGRARLDKRQEETVLRKGVFAAIRNDEAARREAKEFAEASLEDILETKATTVLIPTAHTSQKPDLQTATETPDPPPADITIIQPPNTSAADAGAAVVSSLGEATSVFGTAKFDLSGSRNTEDGSAGLEGLNEEEPDFWVKVARRLGPWTLEEEEEPKELTRADRRRGRKTGVMSKEEGVGSLIIRSPTTAISDDLSGLESNGNDQDDSGDDDDADDAAFSPNSGSGDDSEAAEDGSSQTDDECVALTTGTDGGTKLVRSTPSTREGGTASKDHVGGGTEGDGAPSKATRRRKRPTTTATSDGASTDAAPSQTERKKEAGSGRLDIKRRRLPFSAIGPAVDDQWLKEFGAAPAGGGTGAALTPHILSGNNIRAALQRQGRAAESPGGSQKGSFMMAGSLSLLSALFVTELLFRCLRALKLWQKLKPGGSAYLATDGIRIADYLSSRARRFSSELGGGAGIGEATSQDTITPDLALGLAWLNIFREWRGAGADWERRFSTVTDVYAQKIVQSQKNTLQYCWVESLKASGFKNLPRTKEELLSQMNSFFVSESRKIALLQHGDVIAAEMQRSCDALAAGCIDPSFNRENTARKKQTWIGAEDFCIKLLYMHLIAVQRGDDTHRGGSGAGWSTGLMKWPPPSLEVDWSVITEVIKRFNRIVKGPERRRGAVFERFYNKLDSRWNHAEFSPIEKEICALGAANGIAPNAVAAELPGRTIEKVKKIMRSPATLRDGPLMRAQQVQEALLRTNTTDLIGSFRIVCAELRSGVARSATQKGGGAAPFPPGPSPITTTNSSSPEFLPIRQPSNSPPLVPGDAKMTPSSMVVTGVSVECYSPSSFAHPSPVVPDTPLSSVSESSVECLTVGGAGPQSRASMASRPSPLALPGSTGAVSVAERRRPTRPSSPQSNATSSFYAVAQYQSRSAGNVVSSPPLESMQAIMVLLRDILVRLGVHPTDFELLKPKLEGLQLQSQAHLLRQLIEVEKKAASTQQKPMTTSAFKLPI